RVCGIAWRPDAAWAEPTEPATPATSTAIPAAVTSKVATRARVVPIFIPSPFSSSLDGRSLGRLQATVKAPITKNLRAARDPLCRRQQLVPRAELHARPARLLTGCPLQVVDRRPAGVLDDAQAALREQRIDGGGGRLGLRLEPSRGGVLEQELDRLGRVLLIRADHARRAALDPAGAVDAGLDATTLVRDRAARGVEPHARQLDSVVAHAAEDETARERLVLGRRHSTGVRVELVADELDSLDSLLAEDRHGGVEEAENDLARLALRLSRRERLQSGEVALGVGSLRIGSFEIGRIDNDVGAHELAHLLQLRRGER